MFRNNRVRGLALLTVFVCSFTLALAAPAASPPPARAVNVGSILTGGGILPNPCDLLPGHTLKSVCNAPNNIAGKALGAVGSILPNPIKTITGAVSGAIGDMVTTVLQGIVSAEGAAVGAVLKLEAQFVDNSTAPEITASWFLTEYAFVVGAVVVLAVLGFFVRLTGAIASLEPAEAGKGVLSLSTFLYLAVGLPGLVGAAVLLFDGQVTPAFMNLAQGNMNTTLNHLSNNITNGLNGTAAILLPLIELFFGVIGGIVAEIMLFIRDGFLYIATILVIVSAALNCFGGWARGFFIKSSLTLVATILFKLIMAVTLSIGVALLGSGGGFQAVVAGAGILIAMPLISYLIWRSIATHDYGVGGGIMSAGRTAHSLGKAALAAAA